MPANIIVSDITDESAIISWTELGTADSWEIVVSSQEVLDENELDNYVSVTDPFYSATALAPATTYYVYVRSGCDIDEYSLWKNHTFRTHNIISEIPYVCDFEDENESDKWTFTNGTQSSKWWIGTATNNGGENGLYISTNGSNSSYGYNNEYVYAYSEIKLPVAGEYHFEFDWRANGEENKDLLRAFMIPTSRNPNLSAKEANGMSGTNNNAPEGWIDISSAGTMYGHSDWQNSYNHATFESGIYYLVFFWKNDDSWTNSPAAAVDNIKIYRCPSVVDLTVTNITTESAQINWTERGSAESWEIILSEEELESTELDNYADVEVVTSTSYFATDLEPSTTYYSYIRAVCSDDDHSLWGSVNFNTRNVPTPLPYICGFEDEEENAQWTLTDERSNLWHIGSEVNNGGEYSLCVHDEDAQGNSYYSINIYAYRDIELVENSWYQFEFDWISKGTIDRELLRAFILPSSVDSNLSGGEYNGMYENNNETPEGWIDISSVGLMNRKSVWQHSSASIYLDADAYKLVFFWKNYSHEASNPPVAVDNVKISKITCPSITNLTPIEIASESMTISWNNYGPAESWNVIVSEEELDEAELDTNEFVVTVTDSTYTATGLNPATAYYIYVRNVCSVESKSPWIGKKVSTYQYPAAIPYTCNFEDDEDIQNWLLGNGDQTNKWYIGEGANNGGENGLYISNDNGENNTYDYSMGSYVYASRDIQIDEPSYYQINFDWRAYGFNYFGLYEIDLLRAFLISSTLTPNLEGGNSNGMLDAQLSSLNETPEGWIDVSEKGGPLLNESEWQNSSTEVNLEPGNYKLVFYWQNFGIGEEYGAKNPPAAIDNISIRRITCLSVNNMRVADVTSNSASISWEERGESTSWEIVVSTEILDETQLDLENAVIVNEQDYAATGLSPTTKYNVYVRSVCSDDENSAWKSTNFTTLYNSANILYYCDFEDENENANWSFWDTAYWGYGNPVNWQVSAQYEDASEHNLNIPSSTSGDYIAYAYRTIEVPEDTYCQFKFDWRINSGMVYNAMLAVWVPDTCDINNVRPTGMDGRTNSGINIGETSFMYGESDWQISTYNSRVKAGTYKLLFMAQVYEPLMGVHAYFEIDNIAIYGSQTSIPSVATTFASELSASSATLHGSIISNCGSDVTERGFVYGTDKDNLNIRVQCENANEEFSVQVTGLDANVEYYYRAYAVNADGTGYGDVKILTRGTASHNGYSYVDLGLPSGTLWATANIGANAPNDNGDYFAWGETMPKEENEYNEANYHYLDNPDILPSEADVATVNWGGDWRLPTREEMEELLNYTSKILIKTNSVYPLARLTGPNGNSIIMPFGGSKGAQDELISCSYMSAEPYCMIMATFDGSNILEQYSGVQEMSVHYYGASARPVYTPKLASSYGEEIYRCDFEDASENANWTVNNGSQTNYWEIGSDTNNGGESALYITDGAGYEYDETASSSSYATREIEINEPGKYQFKFDWRSNGEEGYDYTRAFFIHASADLNLTDGNDNGLDYNTPAGWNDIYSDEGRHEGQSDWQHNTSVLTIEETGTYNLVFFWKNNYTAGDNPPAAIDNIVITKLPPVEVITQNATRSSTTATLGGELNNEDDFEISQIGFEYGTRNDLLLDTVKMVYNEDTFSSLITGLTSQTTYYYRAFATFDGDKTVYGDLVQFRTKTNDIDGTEDNPLTIDNAEEWMLFAEAVGTAGGDTVNTYKGFEISNNGDDIYFKLTADLDFAECGNQGPNMFKGHFNGGGKTITYSNIEQGTAPSAFVYIYNATVDSLNILIAESFEIVTEGGLYGALGLSAVLSSISNCTVSVANAEVVLQSSAYASGIIGMAQNSNITNCTNNLSINVTSSMSFAGGIAIAISGGSVNSCTNNASVAARYGAGGIVGIISENGTSITSCLNTGNINGLISAGGILGVGMGVTGDATTIDKCMNTGKLSAIIAHENYFGGIAGLWQDDNSSISISNCANYGSFSELLLATGGIFGVGSVSLSKNIAAPIYEGASVSADNNGYYVYSTIAVPDVAQERYPFTETDDFFDEQVGDIRVDLLRLKFVERGTAKETSQIIGTALQSTLSTNWTYTDGLYPIPAGIPENTKATLARVPIYLATGETVFGVRSNFTVPTSISGQPVTWTSDNAAISISDGTATVTRPAEGENDIDVTITAEYDGCTKTFVVRVIAPKHIPVNTGDVVQDSVVTFNGSFDMETEGVTYAREYGFVYSTNGNLADSTKVVSTNLSGLGPNDERNFSASLSNLEEGTRYYYAAFATTGDTTMLGEIKTFRTEGAPDVTLYYPTWRDTISVGLKAKVDMLGDLETHKFYIGLDRNSLSEISDEAIYSDDDSTFTVTASGLAPETFYYAVAEATDEYGTNHSDTLSFYTYGHFKDDRDNTDYYTIQIGEQTWMAENLRYVGNEVSLGTTASDTEPYYYYPNGDEANVETYGYLYNWPGAMKGEESSDKNPSGVQGICPNGWHLPSDAEWTQLTDYLDNADNAGAMLAGSVDLWESGTLTNSTYFGTSGFGALPVGGFNNVDEYLEFYYGTTFWSATENDSELYPAAYERGIIFHNTSLSRSINTSKKAGISVRCLKGTTIYAYDTVNYCGEQYIFGTQTLTETGDYEETFNLGTDKDSVVYLHLTMYPELTATISNFSNGCNGANNGFVEVSAEGGAGSYTYSWNTPDLQTTARLENVGAGEYVVNVTDVVGCTATASQTLTEPAELIASLSATDILCNGGTSDITNNVAGGTTPYTFAWSNIATTQNLTGVVADTYNVTVTDANNCTVSSSVTVSQPEELTVSLSATDILCNGGTSNITSTVAGGTSDYTYAWNNSETTQNLADVVAGAYSVTVTDTNNCVATASVTVSQPAQLTSSLSADEILCHGETSDITNTVEGGTPEYSYAWSNGSTTQNISSVSAGTYTVTVTDGNDCTATANLIITEPAELTASLSATDILCNGGTSDITNNVAGGTTPYTFAWSNESNTADISGVDAGTYSVTVTDHNNCTTTALIEIAQPELLEVSLSADEILCNGATTNIVSMVVGGTEPYSYGWNNSETTANLTDVVASIYAVTVTDTNGCTTTASTNVGQPTVLTVEISGSLSVCEGTYTTLTANVTGGTADYEYLWSNDLTTATFTTPNITEVTPYSVTVTDANGCTAVTSETVIIGDTPAVEISAATSVCLGSEVVLQANVANAGTGYTVTWSAIPAEGAGLLTTNGERITVTPTESANYTYTAILNANSCSNGEPFESSNDIEVVVNALPDAVIVNNTDTTLITCSITEISLTATGGTSYLWSNGLSAADNTIGDAGIYAVTVTDDNGCSATVQVEISSDTETPSVRIATDVTTLTCSVDTILLQASGAISYQWSNDSTTSAINVATIGTYTVTGTAINGCTGVASVMINDDLEVPSVAILVQNTLLTCSDTVITLTAEGTGTLSWTTLDVRQPNTYGVLATAANGCTSTDSVVITQNIAVPEVSASALEDVICLNTSTMLTATGAESYQWSPVTGLSSTNESEVSAEPTITTTYTVTGTAENGCTASADVTVTVNMPIAYDFEQASCNMFDWNDQTYTESGNYEQTFTAVNGCDSIVTLHLTINTSVTSEFSDTACDSYQWNDSVYTESGDYVQTLQTTNGCDSVVTLHLIVNYTTNGVFADRMCSGVPYEYEGQTFAEAGTYEVVLVNASGCDSIVTLTLTYANDCNGTVSGVITDANTGVAIPNARVTIGNKVTRTNPEGEYSLTVLRGRKTMRVSAVDYMSYSDVIDIQFDTVRNIELYMPQITMDVDSISVTSYPYLAQSDSITLRNIGNTTLMWSSVTDCDNLALLAYDEERLQSRNSRSLWDSIQTFTTQFNAEQAIATDGFFIYTSSWQRPGEFNRYTPDGEYIETFYIENVGMIRNLSFDGTYFYGTEATNVIFKLDLDNQTLVDSITTDISNIRHCSFDRQNGNLLAGDWNSLYSIDTATGVSTQIRNDLMNVYSSAYDNLSPGGPYLWLFSQASQNNGPSAYIRQFSIGNADYTDKTHYLDDIGLGNATLAGGICASEQIREGKFVLLADIQNPSGNNIIATYEIGRTNSIVKASRKSGELLPNESMKIAVREHVTEVGDYNATIRYRAAVMGRQSNDVNVTISAVAPECEAVQHITAVTDTFHTITLAWQPIELGDYDNVSYLVFRNGMQYATDTITETSITYEWLPVGEHCFSVRAMSVGEYTCMSESSDTVCAEIEFIPCNVALTAEAINDGESIFITWNRPIGIDYFRIHRNDDTVDEILYECSYTDSEVVPEVNYCYTITAYFENGVCNEISSTVCSKIVSGLCADAPELYVDAYGGSILLSWTGSRDSYSYQIFRNNVAIGLTTDTTFYDNVARGFEYCYKVERFCEYGMFVYSNEECIFVSETDENAVEEWTADNLSIFPNPTYGQFFIEGQHIADVRVYSASGLLVAEIDNNESDLIEINCDGWNPGLYNVRIISTEGNVVTRKVTIFR
ncbi:MAG: fibronectin type III domain-containing protein [Bacteroidales bacterium]|nr:fibronectin type III domain-containing protein [Bacteroidales bacterium]